MAAEYFRQRAAQEGLSHVVVDSAGTLGIQGAPASKEAVEAIRESGVDLSAHRSKGLRASDLQTTDLVITMEHRHLEYLALHHPEGSDERLLLRAFEKRSRPDPNALDLEDPMGYSLEFYREQLPLITRCVDHLILYLKHRS
jgi:protein-tyrosine phosphatase